MHFLGQGFSRTEGKRFCPVASQHPPPAPGLKFASLTDPVDFETFCERKKSGGFETERFWVLGSAGLAFQADTLKKPQPFNPTASQGKYGCEKKRRKKGKS